MAIDTRERERVHEAPRLMRPVLRGRDEEGVSRRMLPAGAAIIVAVIALLVACFLNAESLRKTAELQPEGWKRDVGLALTRPLVSVSRALALEQPRRQLRRALGRPNENADVTVTFGPRHTIPQTVVRKKDAKGGAAKATKKQPPPKPVFTRSKPMRLWIAGDSLSVVPGDELIRIASRTHVIKPVAPTVDGRVASGLERPDYFDWFDHIRSTVARLHPDAVVLTFGANDNHDYMTGLPKGVDIGSFASPSWVREYRRRVGGVMDDVTSRGAFLVWIGLPIARSDNWSGDFQVLNRIYRSEAKKRAGHVAFVNTYRLFQDKHGRYADYLPNERGDVQRVRSGDGIHFEVAGGNMVAWQVMKAFRTAFRFDRSK